MDLLVKFLFKFFTRIYEDYLLELAVLILIILLTAGIVYFFLRSPHTETIPCDTKPLKKRNRIRK